MGLMKNEELNNNIKIKTKIKKYIEINYMTLGMFLIIGGIVLIIIPFQLIWQDNSFGRFYILYISILTINFNKEKKLKGSDLREPICLYIGYF